MPPEAVTLPEGRRYCPAVVCGLFDSPQDALLALHVAYDEAMNLVAAAWPGERRGKESEAESEALWAKVDGGRYVAALRMSDGAWAACNVFPDAACATYREAQRELAKRLKRGRRGVVIDRGGAFDDGGNGVF